MWTILPTCYGARLPSAASLATPILSITRSPVGLMSTDGSIISPFHEPTSWVQTYFLRDSSDSWETGASKSETAIPSWSIYPIHQHWSSSVYTRIGLQGRWWHSLHLLLTGPPKQTGGFEAGAGRPAKVAEWTGPTTPRFTSATSNFSEHRGSLITEHGDRFKVPSCLISQLRTERLKCLELAKKVRKQSFTC